MKSKFPTRFTVLATLVFTASIPVEAATITFIGGNTVWTDNANTANWSPADEPDLDDDVIFNTANTVPLGSSNSVKSLALSGGISLSTTDFDISVDGLLQLSGAGTDLTVGGSASVVSPDSVTLNSGGEILFNGGSLTMVEETGNGLFDINAGAGISGFGTINLSDGLSAVTTLMSNSGTISASTGNILAVVPPAGTLAINAASVANARLDLDANAPITSVVNVFRNQTLDINVTLADAYSGDMNLFHNSTIDVSTPWSIDAGATVDIVNGFDDNGLLLDIPASTSFINGAAFTQTGGTITVVDTDGTLQFNSAFTQSGGNLVNNGKVVFNANTTIAAGANFTMPGTSSSLTVNPGVVVNVDQADFNSDGSGTSSNIINIGSGGTLNLGLGTGADETLSGAIALNGGTLSVTTIDNTWSVDGSISVGASTGTSQINGDPVTLTSVPVTVGAGSVLVFGATSVLDAAASFSIGNGARVDLGPTTFSNPGTITGAGTLRVGSTSTTAETTVIGVHTFDWDGTGVGSLQTINPGVTLAITSPVFDDDGDMDDPVSLGGNGGKLSVDGPSSWLMKNTFTANNGNVGTSTIGGFSRMVLSGATGLFNINGTTTVTSPFTFGGGSTSTLAAGATLSMQGNTFYDGGNITGAGNLQPGVSTVNSVVVPGVETTSSITTANLNFDLGTWTLNSNSHLIVDVGDYDSDTPANSFGGVITMDGATLTVRSSDSSFIMVGEMNMRGPGTGTAGIHPFAEYTADSDPIIFGDDGPTPNAFLNIGGADLSVIHTPATFMSDAIVNITSPATLLLSGSATFNSVNGAGNAQFTGNGKLLMGGNVTFNEATTLNMPGGRIGLDEGGGDRPPREHLWSFGDQHRSVGGFRSQSVFRQQHPPHREGIRNRQRVAHRESRQSGGGMDPAELRPVGSNDGWHRQPHPAFRFSRESQWHGQRLRSC